MKRQRADGTWTFTTADWDARWYWPVGTRVNVKTVDGLAAGTVAKMNPTSVRVAFADPKDAASFGSRLISMRLLERVQ